MGDDDYGYGAGRRRQRGPLIKSLAADIAQEAATYEADADTGEVVPVPDPIVGSPERDMIATLGVNLDMSRQNHHGGMQKKNQLTTERAKRVLSSLRGLSPPEMALAGAGINKDLLSKYARLADDDEAHPIYRVFIDDFNRLTEEVCRKIIHNASDISAISQDVRWHMYLLERFHPAFRTKVMVEVEHQINIQLNAFIMAIEGEVPPEIFERILEVAASLKPGEATPSVSALSRRG